MSRKSPRIAEKIRPFEGMELAPHYLGYFECFNQQQFYEAHDVLEELWLTDKRGPDGDFYRGLIQLAGAFVHVQKGRFGPASSLLKLGKVNLLKYPQEHHSLRIAQVMELVDHWTAVLLKGDPDAELRGNPPKLLPMAP